MRNLKKFLALVMALVMAFSLMLTANAKDIVKEWDDKDQVDPAFTEAVDVLSGMKVFQGDERGFAPGSTITRAEVAALIYRMATGDVDDVRAGLYANYGNFKDVNEGDWYAGYVGYCANAGYIKGHGGYFNPYDSVTGYEVLAMVLRAAGYDKNHEFEGATWQTNVSALSTQLHIVDDVKTTHYSNTLHLASRRDVVASLLFNTAYKVHMVEYTPIGGYNQYNNLLGEKLNPTLGKLNFGLAYTTRIILGNQATGEGGTLLGVNSVDYEVNDITYTINTEYVYPGTMMDKDWFTPAASAHVTVPSDKAVRLAVETGLDMFGHKVKVWYNEDDNATWKQTYATLDKTELTAIVHPTDANAGRNYVLSADNPKDAAMGAEAQKAGFSVNLTSSAAYYSDDFGRILGGPNYDVAAVANQKQQAMNGAGVTISPNSIYLLISNNKDKTVDVVVSLEAEVGQIARQDTTSTVKSLRLSTPDATTKKSTFTSYTGSGLAAGDLAVESITKGSTTALGSKVVGWKIQGTNNATEYNTDADKNWAGPKGTNSKMPYFQLDNLPETVTAAIQSIGPNNELTMSDGKVYEQSWFRYQFDSTRAADNDKVIGIDGSSAECFTVPTAFQAGVNYTIALDNQGRWLGLTQAKNDFIYGTFADYEFGGLGSGSMKYAITGVNWDGEKVINSEFKSLNLNGTLYPQGANDMGKGYSDDDFEVTKKFLGDVGGTMGNQIKGGAHTGYILDSNGLLDNVVTSAYATELTTPATIHKTDADNGFASFNNGNLLATPNTKFIVVSGTGSDTLDVQVYNGISEFLRGANWVNINATVTHNAGDAHSHTYYITEADRFNKWDTTANKQIASMIMDLRDVQWSNLNDVYYAAPNPDGTAKSHTGVVLAGADPADAIQQYELYKDGVKGYYFVATAAGTVGAGKHSPTAGVAADATVTTGEFYSLIQIKTVNGTPVYKAVKSEWDPTNVAYDEILRNKRTADGICEFGMKYQYVSVTNLSTALFEYGDGTKLTYDVSDAKVVDTCWTNASNRDKIESVLDLNNAISGGYTEIKIAAVYDGVKVSAIYVTSVTTTLT